MIHDTQETFDNNITVVSFSFYDFHSFWIFQSLGKENIWAKIHFYLFISNKTVHKDKYLQDSICPEVSDRISY